MKPAVSRPASPCLVTMGARMTTNAAVGPVTWNLQPPRSATDEPGEDRGVEPVLRRGADGDGERHRERQRHDPDDDAGEDVGAEVAARRSPCSARGGGRRRLGPPCRR